MKILVKIDKLTDQMISKSNNSHMNRNIKIERNKNYQISHCILRVIAFERHCPNSD